MERTSLLPIDKSFSVIMEEVIKDLESTPISNSGPGGVARLLLAKVSAKFGTFYTELKTQHVQAFLSQATGQSIDLIGELINCPRRMDETDDNYKGRIHVQKLVDEKANETAVRLAVLSVEAVKDVILRPFTHGTGSFSVYPILDNPYEWNDRLVSSIDLALKDTASFGIKSTVLQPRIAPIELRIKLLFNQKTAEIDRGLIRTRVTQLIRQKLNTFTPGAKFEIFKLINQVIQSDENILDVEVYHFMVRNRTALMVDQESMWNERFVESTVPGAVLVS